MTETDACREGVKEFNLELRTERVLMEKDFAISGLARSHPCLEEISRDNGLACWSYTPTRGTFVLHSANRISSSRVMSYEGGLR
jgi:hypothetical protein